MRDISDLKNYNKDLLKDEACKKFVSHIMFSRLPAPFRRELVRKLDYNYPTIDQIFDKFVEVYNTLNMNSNYRENREVPKSSSNEYQGGDDEVVIKPEW